MSRCVPSDGAAGVRHAVVQLQAAARAGHNPPLLVMTDQEGGDVRRLPGPPDHAPRDRARALGAVGNMAMNQGDY